MFIKKISKEQHFGNIELDESNNIEWSKQLEVNKYSNLKVLVNLIEISFF